MNVGGNMKKVNVKKELIKMQIKRNIRRHSKYLPFLLLPLITIISINYFSKASYNSNTTYLPVNNKVEEFKAYDYLIAAYINNEETFSYPLKNTGYELDSFTCDNAVGSWNRDSWSLNLTNISARTKCNLYFRNATYSLKYYIGDTEVSTIPSSSDYNFTSASCDNGASISFNTDTWSPTVSNILGDNVCSLKFEDKITIINFTISGTPYQAEKNMTWGEWVSSSYNNGEFFTENGEVLKKLRQYIYKVSINDCNEVCTSDKINDNTSYSTTKDDGHCP